MAAAASSGLDSDTWFPRQSRHGRACAVAAPGKQGGWTCSFTIGQIGGIHEHVRNEPSLALSIESIINGASAQEI